MMDEIVVYSILALSLIANFFQWFGISNLLNQNEQLEVMIKKSIANEDRLNVDVEKYHQVLQGLFTRALADLHQVDAKGAFQSDDEVGWTFKMIVNIIQDVADRLQNLKRNNEDEG